MERNVKKLAFAVLGGMLLLGSAATGKAAPTTVTGTLELTLTVSVVSAVPAGSSIQCSFFALVADDVNFLDSILESVTVIAKTSGSTAICRMQIPYEWVLHDLANDKVGLSYSISATNTIGVGRSNSNDSFQTISVPRTGVTTSFSAKGRI
jgi:hypothetical protein